MKNKILLLLISCLYIGIPILILFVPKLYDLKFYILTIVGILIYGSFRICKISNKELGITKFNLFMSIKRNLPLIILFIGIIIIFKIFGIAKYNTTETILFYLFYVFISCPIQEFLYRGVFGYFENNLIKNRYITVVISSLCYSFVHIIYKDFFTCLLTFIIGVIWYFLYKKDNNLTGVCLSHIVLGITTIALGIIN